MRFPWKQRQRAEEALQELAAPVADIDSIQVDTAGTPYYTCSFEGAELEDPSFEQAVITAAEDFVPVPVSPFPAHLEFSSLPGATNVFFLDFNGHMVSNTAWNTGDADVFDTRPFSRDDDFDMYSSEEQALIKQIWLRVAEDFAPFNINVTTVEPPSFGQRVGRCLITRNVDANSVTNPMGCYRRWGGLCWCV